MDKKRILVYTESYLPAVGGLENNTSLLCQTLTDLGHIVTLLTPQKNATLSHTYPVNECKRIRQYFKEVKKNELVVVNGGISFKIIFPCLLLNKPYMVIYQMASLFNNIHSNDFRTRFTNKIRKTLAKKAELNIGVSKYSYNELTAIFGNNKSALLINPANPIFQDKSPAKKDKSSFDCLFTGRLIEGKGIRLLIAAIETLRKENLSVNLHIIGDGPEKEWIKSKLNLNYLFLYPPISPERLKEYYQNADLTIIPSTTHIEGSPLVMAESLAVGTPVLVADQPAMLTSVNHQNMYFKSHDLDDLTSKLRALLKPQVYEEVLEHSNRLANNYHYNNYISHLEKIINA